MRAILTLISTLYFTNVYSQNCECNKLPYLKELIICKEFKFSNGAKIYWNYDCNSSKIIFENRNLKKIIFELEKELIEYSGRLGYINWNEYKNSFLIENKVISGCCQPSEYILYNKENGEIIAELGTIIKLDNSNEYPFIITLKSENILLFTNLSSNRIYKIDIPGKLIEKTMQYSNILYAENLFENIELKNGLLKFDLKYKKSENSMWTKKQIQHTIN